MWFEKVDEEEDEKKIKRKGEGKRILMREIGVKIGNKKIMVLYIEIMKKVVDIKNVQIKGWVEMIMVMLMVMDDVDKEWVVMDEKERKFLRRKRMMRIEKRKSEGMMEGDEVEIEER